MPEGRQRKRFAVMFEDDRRGIERRMDELLPPASEPPQSLHGSMRYAALGAGKRIRGVLCIQAHRLLGDAYPAAVLDAACALEYLHAYTLVHDDLPALDDDDTRRGRPSCHVEFGEAGAILAGDALQAFAFEVLAGCRHAPPGRVLRAVRILASAAGSRFLVGGQVADLEGEHIEPDPDRIEFIHTRKTAALISAALAVGAVLAGCSQPRLGAISEAGREVGLAFQIVDDLLDISGSEQAVGKGLRKDSRRGKMTWPACHGEALSRGTAQGLVEAAAGRARNLGDTGYLEYLFRLVVDRTS